MKCDRRWSTPLFFRRFFFFFFLLFISCLLFLQSYFFFVRVPEESKGKGELEREVEWVDEGGRE